MSGPLVLASLDAADEPGTYQRHAFAEERKRALDVWAAHVLRHGEAEAPANDVDRLSGRAR